MQSTSSISSTAKSAAKLHTERALSQIQSRNSRLPSIDFTVHVGDDGQEYSTTERVVKDVQAPAFLKPTDEQFYHDETRTKPDIAFLKNHFYREGRLTDEQVCTRFQPPPTFVLPSPLCVRAIRWERFADTPSTSIETCRIALGYTRVAQALFILTEASKVLRDEPNLLEVDAPITGTGTRASTLICRC